MINLNQNPRRHWWGVMPKKTDGSGYVFIRMAAGNAAYFKLDELPDPPDLYRTNPETGTRTLQMRKVGVGKTCGSYRIALREFTEGGVPRTVRFTLSSGYVMESLEVLTNHLNEKNIEWLWIANKNGNPVSTSCLRSTAF
jgi:hypothetical protein